MPFCSVHCEGQAPPPRVPPITHLDGYLPRDGVPDHGSEIVFAEDACHTQFPDPYARANITQLNLLRERAGFFVGFSMTAPNLRRLLDVANRYRHGRPHYVILKSPSREPITSGGTAALDEARHAAFMGAFRSIQKDALAEPGLSVIRVEHFEEIPALLDGIRRSGLQPLDGQGKGRDRGPNFQ